MSETLNVITLCGSLRAGSFNAALARQLPKLAPAGLSIKPGPALDQIPHYNSDVQDKGDPAPVTALADAIRAADGLIVVSPEYNWSVPGMIKNAIDWISKVKDQPLVGKPVALQSCAGGLLGGSRMQYHMRQIMTSVEATVLIRPEVFVTFSAKKFDANLELTDQPTLDMIKAQLVNFEKLIRKLTGKA
jgi:chromate reductase, NAD(P)H dehydrogenase (quinone)